MVEKNTQLDDTLHVISRFTIIVPLVVIILAVIIKFNNVENKGSVVYNLPTPTVKQSPSDIFNQLKQASISAKLNLKGPFSCTFSSSTATLSAFIKDRKISTRFIEKNKVRNFLLRDDCLYIWDDGNFSGEKVCGLGNYISLADNLLSSNLLDFESIISNLTQFGNVPKSMTDANSIKNLVSSCKMEGVIDNKVFDIPVNVLFKNKTIK